MVANVVPCLEICEWCLLITQAIVNLNIASLKTQIALNQTAQRASGASPSPDGLAGLAGFAGEAGLAEPLLPSEPTRITRDPLLFSTPLTLRVVATPEAPSRACVPPPPEAPPCWAWLVGTVEDSTSTVKITNELGGTTGGLPAAPYAMVGAQVMVAF